MILPVFLKLNVLQAENAAFDVNRDFIAILNILNIV